MVGLEQTSIARQRLSNHVPAATNINKELFTLQRLAANESLPFSKSLNEVIPVRTEELFDGDFYPGSVEIIKGNAFVNSR
jgi:hypothetical protein